MRGGRRARFPGRAVDDGGSSTGSCGVSAQIRLDGPQPEPACPPLSTACPRAWMTGFRQWSGSSAVSTGLSPNCALIIGIVRPDILCVVDQILSVEESLGNRLDRAGHASALSTGTLW